MIDLLVADESVDLPIVNGLRARGIEVLYVAEMDPGIDDEAVLDEANRHQGMLLTQDKDFGELVFRLGRVSAGVVLIRLAGLTPAAKAEIVVSAVEEHAQAFRDNFSVISPGSLRIRAQILPHSRSSLD